MSILLLKAGGLRPAEAQFGRDVAVELAGAFPKRLCNSLPPTAVIGHWSEDRFVAILQGDQPEAAAPVKRIAENLAGAYACLKSGKAMYPAAATTRPCANRHPLPETTLMTAFAAPVGVLPLAIEFLPRGLHGPTLPDAWADCEVRAHLAPGEDGAATPTAFHPALVGIDDFEGRALLKVPYTNPIPTDSNTIHHLLYLPTHNDRRTADLSAKSESNFQVLPAKGENGLRTVVCGKPNQRRGKRLQRETR